MNADVIPFPLPGTLGRLARIHSVASDVVAAVDRALAANEVAVRGALPHRVVRVRSWHESIELEDFPRVQDTTAGRWPRMCEARTSFFDLAGVEFAAICTRPKGHTGRHAQGSDGRIVAVWEDPSEARP